MSKDRPQSLGLMGTPWREKCSQMLGVSIESDFRTRHRTMIGQERRAATKYCDWVGNTVACFVLLFSAGPLAQSCFSQAKYVKNLKRPSSADSIKRKLLVRIRICQGQGIKWVPWVWERLWQSMLQKGRALQKRQGLGLENWSSLQPASIPKHSFCTCFSNQFFLVGQDQVPCSRSLLSQFIS